MSKPTTQSAALVRTLRAAPRAELLAAVFELARNYNTHTGPKINGPRDADALVRGMIAGKQTEHLAAVALDAQNQPVAVFIVTKGALNTTRTLPREIYGPALRVGAVGVLLAHNHPSGKLEPSPEDADFTNQVAKAGTLLGVELYDHLIITRDGFLSMRERGML